MTQIRFDGCDLSPRDRAGTPCHCRFDDKGTRGCSATVAARVSLRTSYARRSHTWVSLSGENLLNRQLGEPDNVTVVPGRTITLGLRTAF